MKSGRVICFEIYDTVNGFWVECVVRYSSETMQRLLALHNTRKFQITYRVL